MRAGSNEAEWKTTGLRREGQAWPEWNTWHKMRKWFTGIPRSSRCLLLTVFPIPCFDFHAKVNSWAVLTQRTQSRKMCKIKYTASETQRGRAYIFLHGTQISGTFVVSIILCQVCCCEPINILVWRVRLIGQQDFTALRQKTGKDKLTMKQENV